MFHSHFNTNTFFLGCAHINHTNICKGVSKWTSGGMRDFTNLDTMNNAIINNVNANVKESDHLFLLGDILFGPKVRFHEFFSRINCRNLYLLFGNHCDWIRNDIEKLSRFKWYGDYLEIFINKQLLCLFHYPINEWRDCHKGSYCICSHSHGGNEFSNPNTSKYKCLDVGWDVFNKPVSFIEIKAIMDTKFNKGHH
jgi:calcineurin-like phosphoesterase family protein